MSCCVISPSREWAREPVWNILNKSRICRYVQEPREPSLSGVFLPFHRVLPLTFSKSRSSCEGVGGLGERFEVLSVVLVGVRQAAVAADSDLGLVCVDEDPGVAGRAAATVASNNAVVRPSHGLLVDEGHRRVRLGLDCHVRRVKRHLVTVWKHPPGDRSQPARSEDRSWPQP